MTNDMQPFLDNPQQLTTQPIEIQLAVANNAATPRELLELLTASNNHFVARAAQNHVNWAGELNEDCHEAAEKLLRNSNDRLAVELLKFAPVPECFLSEWVPSDRLLAGVKNPYLPGRYRVKLLERLAREPFMLPRLEAAENPETPTPVLEELAGDVEFPVRLAVRHNPNCPTETIAEVEDKEAFASNWETDPQQLAELGESRWSWVRLAVAQNPSAPPQVLEKLAENGFYPIQLAVARNPSSPTAALEKLIEIDEQSIWEALAKHPNASARILLELLPDRDDRSYEKEYCEKIILERANLPAAVIEGLLEKSNRYYGILKQPNVTLAILKKIAARGASLADIASHPSADATLLEELAKKEDARVRLAVAQNLNAPMELRERLYEELVAGGSEGICREIAADPNTPIFVLERIGQGVFYLNSRHREIALALAANPNTPGSFLEWLKTKLTWSEVCRDWGLRLALTFNPTIPASQRQEYLEEAVASGGESQRAEALAKHPQTPTSILERLSDRGEKMLRAIAENPNAQVELLRKAALQAKDNIYRLEPVASNPNTPADLLEQLAEQFIPKYWRRFLNRFEQSHHKFLQAIVQHPNLERNAAYRILLELYKREDNAKLYKYIAEKEHRLYLLEEVIKSGDGDALRTLARRHDIPGFMVERLAEHPYKSVRFAAIDNRDLCPGFRLALTRDPSPEIRSEIARQNPYYKDRRVPPLILERLANDESEIVREVVAENPNIPVGVLAQLANDPSRKVKAKVVRNRKTPVEILERLGLSEGIFSKRNPKTPARVLAEAVERAKNSDALIELLKYPLKRSSQMPAETLEKLASHSRNAVRRHVAEHPNTPVSALELLAEDEDWSTRVAVCKNRNTPARVLESLFQREDPSGEGYNSICRELLCPPDTPASILEVLAKSPDPKIRRGTAGNSNTPLAALEGLLKTGSEEVLQSLSRNPSLTPQLQAQLLERGADEVLANLTRNPSLTPELQRQLARHPEPNIRYLVVYHPNSTPELWQQLAADESAIVRGAIAIYRNCPLALLETLAKDEDKEVRSKAAANPKAPVPLLETLSRDSAPEVRAAVAKNAIAPLELLEKLAADEDVNVRWSVVSNDAAPRPLKESLQKQLLEPAVRKTKTGLRGLVRIYDPDAEDLSSLLSEYALSPVDLVRFVALMHPLTPAEALREGSESLWWWERYAVAANPGAPAEIREKLIGDSDRIVRATARRQLRIKRITGSSRVLRKPETEKIATTFEMLTDDLFYESEFKRPYRTLVFETKERGEFNLLNLLEYTQAFVPLELDRFLKLLQKNHPPETIQQYQNLLNLLQFNLSKLHFYSFDAPNFFVLADPTYSPKIERVQIPILIGLTQNGEWLGLTIKQHKGCKSAPQFLIPNLEATAKTAALIDMIRTATCQLIHKTEYREIVLPSPLWEVVVASSPANAVQKLLEDAGFLYVTKIGDFLRIKSWEKPGEYSSWKEVKEYKIKELINSLLSEARCYHFSFCQEYYSIHSYYALGKNKNGDWMGVVASSYWTLGG
ncbi:MAG: HEAT repeat domain-containing protein [Cyanobacteriota bacterium]|nr:HEAT repeat domain-containing protein [Cyanobacteriota bacterium]